MSGPKRTANPRSLRYRSLTEIGRDLLRITADCRDDMHEPDECGISARVNGRVLDNAGGPRELHVVITDARTGYYDTFNLATLVALARIGARHT